MADIVMPRLSDTMEEGTILRWLVADGEQVSRGQELVEIETDKANMTYESDQEGVLQRIAAEGDTLPVGAVIARIGSDDSDASVSTTAKNDKQGSTEGEVPEAPPAVDPPAEDPSTGERVKASPLAKRIASQRGVDLHTVTGSGPGGRIVKADVQEATAEPPSATGLTRARPPLWSSLALSRRSRGGCPSRRPRSPTSPCRPMWTWRPASRCAPS
jgi:pyruvate dehydrogenase E2 component (dihydrolipoamide acetyltransferase)